MNEELGIGIGGGMAGPSVFYVVMSVSVVHVLWECSAYKDSREEFLIKLRSTLEEAFKENIERASFVLGCELWMENLDSMLVILKEYIINVWEVRKV